MIARIHVSCCCHMLCSGAFEQVQLQPGSCMAKRPRNAIRVQLCVARNTVMRVGFQIVACRGAGATFTLTRHAGFRFEP